MTFTTLTIVRHGPTSYTRDSLYCGSSNPALTSAGMEIARSVGNAAGIDSADVIVSSPLKRALQTAMAVSGRLRLPVVTDARLREISYGDWEGQPPSSLKNTKAYERWLKDPSRHAPPGGETAQNALERAAEAVGEYFRKHDHILLFTHKGVIRLLYCFYTALPLEQYREVSGIPTGSITTFTFENNRMIGATLGDTAHIPQEYLDTEVLNF